MVLVMVARSAIAIGVYAFSTVEKIISFIRAALERYEQAKPNQRRKRNQTTHTPFPNEIQKKKKPLPNRPTENRRRIRAIIHLAWASVYLLPLKMLNGQKIFQSFKPMINVMKR